MTTDTDTPFQVPTPNGHDNSNVLTIKDPAAPAKPKRKRRTKKEMEAFRAAQARKKAKKAKSESSTEASPPERVVPVEDAPAPTQVAEPRAGAPIRSFERPTLLASVQHIGGFGRAHSEPDMKVATIARMAALAAAVVLTAGGAIAAARIFWF